MAAAVGDGAEIKASGGIGPPNSPPHSSCRSHPSRIVGLTGGPDGFCLSSAICRVSIAVPVLPGSGWCES